MKLRIVLGICGVAAALSVSAAPAQAQDCNGDGRVNSLDILGIGCEDFDDGAGGMEPIVCGPGAVEDNGLCVLDADILAEGLDNPRGLALGPNGALYVAEAGRGGAGPCTVGAEGEVCYGKTGAITRIWGGQQERIVTGLPSLAFPDSNANPGGNATGPHDVAVLGPGNVFTLIGLGFDPAVRAPDGPLGANGAAFGQLVLLSGAGGNVADIAGFEAVANPDGQAPDSNPFSLFSTLDGHFVADAGANALLHVTLDGTVSTVATFPIRPVDAPPFLELPDGAQLPMQSVPTTVTYGPDGALYVGELTGFPFPLGAARVYRIRAGKAEMFAEGFTNIVDIAFGPNGDLYVLEIATNSLLSGDTTGALIRVPANGAAHEIVASEGLFMPSSVLVGPQGIYVSNCGVCAGAGQVVHIPLPAE
jgi:hypothetical protein